MIVLRQGCLILDRRELLLRTEFVWVFNYPHIASWVKAREEVWSIRAGQFGDLFLPCASTCDYWNTCMSHRAVRRLSIIVLASIRCNWVCWQCWGIGRAEELLGQLFILTPHFEISLICGMHHRYQMLLGASGLSAIVFIGGADTLISILFKHGVGVEKLILHCGQLVWTLLFVLIYRRIVWPQTFLVVLISCGVCKWLGTRCEVAFWVLNWSQSYRAIWRDEV